MQYSSRIALIAYGGGSIKGNVCLLSNASAFGISFLRVLMRTDRSETKVKTASTARTEAGTCRATTVFRVCPRAVLNLICAFALTQHSHRAGLRTLREHRRYLDIEN